MELFTVKRYTEEPTIREIKNEDVILQNLLQKVEKRKNKRKRDDPSKLVDDVAERKPTKSFKASEENVEADVNEVDARNVVNTSVEAINENEAGDDGTVGFEVLGEDIVKAAASQHTKKIDMVLPPWLAHPTIISTNIVRDGTEDDSAAIAKLSYLAPHICSALKELQVTSLFPVQTAVIPWLLEAHAKPAPFRPRDICVSAPTGSGKTLAFAIPIVQLLNNRVQRKISALVVLPVAELALQVFKVFKKLCEKTDLSVCLLSKQFTFALEQEKLIEYYKGEYYSKVDIVVSTPGRLVDHMHATKGLCLNALKFLVIDEADRIMDAVFQNWLYHLDSHVRSTSDQLLSGRSAPLSYLELLQNANSQPHKLLFSATLSQDPEKLQSLRLFQPKLFTSVLAPVDELHEITSMTAETEKHHATAPGGEFIGKYTTPAELTEKYCITESRLKPLTLYSLINENGWKKFLCFTNSAESSSRLAFVLQNLFKENLVIEELSAAMSATLRSRAMSKFSRGAINGLICSDALARGIDIPDVEIVISYDPPRHIKTYIHRIGRTARAGRKGTAITLLTQKELIIFTQILAEVGKSLTEEIPVCTTTEEEQAKNYTLVLQSLRKKIEKEKLTKVLHKERAKQRSFIHKDPAKLSLMEKLQIQADEHLQKTITAKQEKKLALEKKKADANKTKVFRGKKFNASAGKNKAIKK